MQLNVRNLSDATAERLSEQAAAEGLSVSEWVRQALDATAQLATPAELMARRAANLDSAMPAHEFEQWYLARLHRRAG